MLHFKIPRLNSKFNLIEGQITCSGDIVRGSRRPSRVEVGEEGRRLGTCRTCEIFFSLEIHFNFQFLGICRASRIYSIQRFKSSCQFSGTCFLYTQTGEGGFNFSIFPLVIPIPNLLEIGGSNSLIIQKRVSFIFKWVCYVLLLQPQFL